MLLFRWSLCILIVSVNLGKTNVSTDKKPRTSRMPFSFHAYGGSNPALLNPRASDDPSYFRFQMPSNPDDSLIPLTRNKRDGVKPFTEFVDRISSIARLANTIQLQSDITNNRDMPYKVGELLNIGKIDAEALKRINTTQLAFLMKFIDKTAQHLGDGATAEENRVKYWDEIRRVTKNLGDIKDFPNRDEYFNDVDKFDRSFDHNAFDKAVSSAENVLSSLKALNEYSIENATLRVEKEDGVNRCITLHRDITSSITSLNELKQHIDSLSVFKEVNSESKRSVLEKPDKLIHAIYWREKLHPLAGTNSLDKYYVLVDDLIKEVKSSDDVYIDEKLLEHFHNSSSDLQGFEAVALLGDELKSEWFEKFLKNTGDGLKIVNSLKPIFKLKTTKLINSSFSKNLETRVAIEDMNIIMQELKNTTSHFQRFSTFLTNPENCRTQYGKPMFDFLKPVVPYLKYLKKFTEMFSDFWHTDIFHDGLHTLLNDLTGVKQSLTPIDSKDYDKSFKKLPGVINELNRNGTMKRIQKLIRRFVDTLYKFKMSELSDAAAFTVNSRKEIEKFLKLPNVINEHYIHECLQLDESESTTAYEGVRIIRMIRQFGRGSEQVLNFIREVEEIKVHLDEYKSIPSLIKKSSSDGVEKVNRINSSVTARIEKAVNSIRNLVAIKDMGLLEQLCDIQSQSFLDMYQMDLLGTNKEMKKAWPLKEVIMSLEKSLEYFEEQTEAFNYQKLSNLSDFDAFFVNLRDIPKITMEPESMIHVLDYFTETTPYEEHIDAYTKTKEKLVDISSMNLDFAKHFRGVGDAFQEFGDFLTQALVMDSVQDHTLNPVQDRTVDPVLDQDGQKELDKNDYTWIIVGCVVFVASLSAVAVFFLWKKKLLCFKRKGKSVECDVIDMDPVDNKPVLPPDLIIVAIAQQTFGRHPEHYELWTQLLEHVRTAPTPEERQFPYLPLNESKYFDPNIKLNPFNALQSVRLHGNKFRSRLGTVFYAMQVRMRMSWQTGHKSLDHTEQRPQWKPPVIDKVEFIVFLGETNSCGRYFKEGVGCMTIENFTVTTEGEQQVPNSADIIIRTLKITDKKKKTQRKVKQFQVKNWKEGDIPNCGFEQLEAIMTEICKSKSPVVVHCTSGTGRTMSFIGMEYISRLLEANDEMPFADGFKKLSEKRYSSFESARQIGWMQVGVVYFMTIRHNTEMVMYRNIEGDFRDMVERSVGVPKGMKF